MKFKANPGVPDLSWHLAQRDRRVGGGRTAVVRRQPRCEDRRTARAGTRLQVSAKPPRRNSASSAAKASCRIKATTIATLAADVYSDGYVDAQVTFNLHFPFDSSEPVIEVSGGAGFWDEPASGLWQAKGNVYFKLWIISAEVGGVDQQQIRRGLCARRRRRCASGAACRGATASPTATSTAGCSATTTAPISSNSTTRNREKEHKGGFVKEESRDLPDRAPRPWRTRRLAHARAGRAGRSRHRCRRSRRRGGGRRFVLAAHGTARPGAAHHLVLGHAGGDAQRSRRTDLYDAVDGRPPRHRPGAVHERGGARPAPGAGAAAPPQGRQVARPAGARRAAGREASNSPKTSRRRL